MNYIKRIIILKVNNRKYQTYLDYEVAYSESPCLKAEPEEALLAYKLSGKRILGYKSYGICRVL